MYGLYAAITPVLMDWNVESILTEAKKKIESWGKILVVVIGLIMVIAGIIQVAQGLISHGKAQTNWPVAIGLIVIGGALAFGTGWSFVKNVAGGLGKEAEGLGGTGGTGGTSFILPSLWFK